MVTEAEFQFIPEYATPEARRIILELAEEPESRPCPVEACEHLIRHWCETLEDGNPLYIDEDYARSRGFDGLVAPPGSVMTTFAMQFRWPWPQERAPARHIHYEIKELLEPPINLLRLGVHPGGLPRI